MRLRKPGNFDVKHCTGAPRPNGALAHIRIRRFFVTPPGNCNTSFVARCATVSAPGSPRPDGAPAHIRIRRSFVTPQWSRGWFPPRQLQHKFRGALCHSLRPTIPYLTHAPFLDFSGMQARGGVLRSVPHTPFPHPPARPRLWRARAQHSYMAVGYYCRIARTPGWPPGGRLPKSLRRDQLYTIDPKSSRTLLFFKETS